MSQPICEKEDRRHARAYIQEHLNHFAEQHHLCARDICYDRTIVGEHNQPNEIVLLVSTMAFELVSHELDSLTLPNNVVIQVQPFDPEATGSATSRGVDAFSLDTSWHFTPSEQQE